MTNSQKIEIAKDFISHHKKADISEWATPPSEGGPSYGAGDDEILLHVFDRLNGGLYGDIRTDEEYNDDGEVVSQATEFEIEIDGFDHKSGNPFIFTWAV